MEKLKMYVVLLLTAVLLIPLGSCDKCKGTEEVKQVAFKYLQYELESSEAIYLKSDYEKALIGSGSANSITPFTHVINSQEEYNLFSTRSGKPLPQVDFNKYTVLTLFVLHVTALDRISEQVIQNCNTYTYSVQGIPGVNQSVQTVMRTVLIPKIPKSAKVNFNWEIKF